MEKQIRKLVRKYLLEQEIIKAPQTIIEAAETKKTLRVKNKKNSRS